MKTKRDDTHLVEQGAGVVHQDEGFKRWWTPAKEKKQSDTRVDRIDQFQKDDYGNDDEIQKKQRAATNQTSLKAMRDLNWMWATSCGGSRWLPIMHVDHEPPGPNSLSEAISMPRPNGLR